MSNVEYIKWFSENMVAGEKDVTKGIYNYTVGSYKFTTKLTKSGHLSLYDVTNGKVCVATRIYDDYGAIEDSISVYLFKKLGVKA
jgi:hypothetical protein